MKRDMQTKIRMLEGQGTFEVPLHAISARKSFGKGRARRRKCERMLRAGEKEEPSGGEVKVLDHNPEGCDCD